MKDPLM